MYRISYVVCLQVLHELIFHGSSLGVGGAIVYGQIIFCSLCKSCFVLYNKRDFLVFQTLVLLPFERNARLLCVTRGPTWVTKSLLHRMIADDSEREICQGEGLIVHSCACKLNLLVRCEFKCAIVLEADSGATTTWLASRLRNK
jgi:hypothetical protein